MDPVSIVGLVEGSISLAVQCGSVAKSLNTLAGQYTYAQLTISTMVQNLDIMQLAWDRIGAWSKNSMPIDNDGFMQRLERFLQTGSLVLDALEEDLQPYNVSNMTLSQRSRLLWNESILQAHQNRIRDQAQSMSLLLQAVQLPTPQATTTLLRQSEKQFIKSDESALSIVPSNMSSKLSTSTDQTGRRDSISSYASMVYRRLSFEDDLFTARVYKRNYRNPRLQRLLASEHQGYRVTTTSQGDKDRNKNRTADLTAGSFSEVATDVEISSDPADTNAKPLVWLTPPEITASTSADPYVQLVEACGRGDNKRVLELLGLQNSEARLLLGVTWNLMSESEVSGFTSEYTVSSLYFCPIYAAVSNGQVEVMQTLLRCAESDSDVGRVIEKEIGGTITERWRPLHLAAMNDHLRMVELLLEYGADVNGRTRYGTQAIHLAARIGSTAILAALVAAGADVNCADRDGRQPLHYSTDSRDQPDVVHYLAKKGAEINGLSLSSEPRPIHLACKNSFTGNINELLSLGALADNSVLDTAIRSMSTSVGVLLRQAKNTNRCRFDSGTGLHTFGLAFYAATAPRAGFAAKRTLRLLLEDLDPLAKNENGSTVLDILFQFPASTDKAATLELASLFLEYLPEHKLRERKVLRSIIRRYEGTEVVNDHSSIISAPIISENSLGWN